MDVASMAETSTRVFVYEAMGRHAGWLAASAGLAARRPGCATPDPVAGSAFDQERFLARVKATVEKVGWCTGGFQGVRDADGRFLAEPAAATPSVTRSWVAPPRPWRSWSPTGSAKHHWAVPDYLQRSARHIARPPTWPMPRPSARPPSTTPWPGRMR